MGSWRPRTTALGGLPNISLVVRKPGPICKFSLYEIDDFDKIFILSHLIFLIVGTEFITAAYL
jgi:hypothetical protein